MPSRFRRPGQYDRAMAAGILTGAVPLAPQRLTRQNDQLTNALLLKQNDPDPRIFNSGWGTGAALLGNALATLGAMKGRKASSEQQSAALAAALGAESPEAFQTAVGGLGELSQAEQLAIGMKAKDFEDPESENLFAKINPKDFTKESVAEFQRTGDFSSLQVRTEDDKEVPLTNIAKLRDDFQNGRITKDEFEAMRAKLTEITGRTEYDALPAGARTAIAKDLTDLKLLKDELKSIDPGQAEESLTWAGKAKRFLALTADSAGLQSEAGTEFLRRDQDFRAGVERIFFGLRKQITGAQAAFIELEQLKDATLSSDQTPTQFRASYDRYTRRTNELIGVYESLLKDGIDPSTDGGGKEFERRAGSIEPQESNVVNWDDL